MEHIFETCLEIIQQPSRNVPWSITEINKKDNSSIENYEPIARFSPGFFFKFDVMSIQYSASISLHHSDYGYETHIQQKRNFGQIPSYKSNSDGSFFGTMTPSEFQRSHKPIFSMFGTSRTIKEFYFRIHKNPNWQGAFFSGSFSHVMGEAPKIFVEDSLYLNIEISPIDFAQIMRQLDQKQDDVFNLIVNRPAGFYAVKDHFDLPTNFKILLEETKVDLLNNPTDKNISLEHLGFVEEFRFLLAAPLNNKLLPQKSDPQPSLIDENLKNLELSRKYDYENFQNAVQIRYFLQKIYHLIYFITAGVGLITIFIFFSRIFT
jgi:hypothetical protein